MRRCVVHCGDVIAAAAARRTLINPHQWQIALHRSLTRCTCKLGVGRLGLSARNPIISGVTRVGVTRGGNWGCHPYLFSPEKWRPVLLITVTFIDFTLVSSPCRLSPRTFFTCPTSFIHYSLFICPEKNFPSGVTPLEGDTRCSPPYWRHCLSYSERIASSENKTPSERCRDINSAHHHPLFFPWGC